MCECKHVSWRFVLFEVLPIVWNDGRDESVVKRVVMAGTELLYD
jgi:hypothetical protein